MTSSSDSSAKRIFDGSMDTQISRRTLAKGAAWSLPVIALAAAAPQAAATVGTPFDLSPAFTGPSLLTLGVLVEAVTVNVDVNLFEEVTVSNLGETASPAGATITITYDPLYFDVDAGLVTNLLSVTVDPVAGSITGTLAPIPGGGNVVINLGISPLLSGLADAVAGGLVGVESKPVSATVIATGEANTDNNAAVNNYTLELTAVP